jgi:Zn-dependent M28 family amino/carboxypeptidase
VGAEESGLIGSTAYVNGLSQAERDRIALFLNYDIVDSPNYVFMVYDADQSTFPRPRESRSHRDRRRSRTCTSRTTRWSVSRYDDTQFSGRSDYQAFIVNGISSGGLFTGAEVVKTAEQEAIWSGTAGEQLDRATTRHATRSTTSLYTHWRSTAT